MNSYAPFNQKQVNYLHNTQTSWFNVRRALHNNGEYYGYHFKRGW